MICPPTDSPLAGSPGATPAGANLSGDSSQDSTPLGGRPPGETPLVEAF